MFSLIIPVYRNEESLPSLIAAIADINQALDGKLEAVFVVDGSPDRSYALLRNALPNASFASQLLVLSRNFGAFAAIRCGLQAAGGRYFAVMAADLQEPPELAVEFFQRLERDEADADFARTGEIYTSVYGDKHYLVALARANRASVYLARKQFTEAEAQFRDVIARFNVALSPTHMNTGIAHIKLGRALLGEKRYREAVEEILAGYRTLSAQTDPSVTWLKSARTDLITAYEALHEPEKAAAFRAEMEKAAAAEAGSAAADPDGTAKK